MHKSPKAAGREKKKSSSLCDLKKKKKPQVLFSFRLNLTFAFKKRKLAMKNVNIYESE